MHNLQNNLSDVITVSLKINHVQETAVSLLGRNLTMDELQFVSNRLSIGVDSSLDLLCRLVILEELPSSDFSG